MSIVALQRRLVEVGRIRMGEKRTSSKSGKQYPAKLDTWRLTSTDRRRLDAAALVYGGTVKDWDGQYELITETAALDIALIPGQALVQHMEHWGQQHPQSFKGPNPVLCLRRCDGQTESLSEKPCVCVAEAGDDGDLLCKPTTHLLVVLRRVPGIGAWRLSTRGWYAAQELAGTANLLEQLTARGQMVPARLRLDQRTAVRATETRNYVVPVIDIDATLDEVLVPLGGGNGNGHALNGGPVRELEAPARSFTPVAVSDLAAGPQRSVREQALAAPPERARRSNAAQPIPATGLRPRGVVAASPRPTSGGEGDAASEPESRGDDVNMPARDDRSTGEASPPQQPSSDGDDEGPSGGFKNVGHACSWAGLEDDGRHQLCEWVSGGRTSSSKELTADEQSIAVRACVEIKNRRARVTDDVDGARLVNLFGFPTELDKQVDALHGVERGAPIDVESAPSPTLDETRVLLRARIEALGDYGKASWKKSGLPALSRLTADRVQEALDVVTRAEAAGEPF